jgi:hypothetical protein
MTLTANERIELIKKVELTWSQKYNPETSHIEITLPTREQKEYFQKQMVKRALRHYDYCISEDDTIRILRDSMSELTIKLL